MGMCEGNEDERRGERRSVSMGGRGGRRVRRGGWGGGGRRDTVGKSTR